MKTYRSLCERRAGMQGSGQAVRMMMVMMTVMMMMKEEARTTAAGVRWSGRAAPCSPG